MEVWRDPNRDTKVLAEITIFARNESLGKSKSVSYEMLEVNDSNLAYKALASTHFFWHKLKLDAKKQKRPKTGSNPLGKKSWPIGNEHEIRSEPILDYRQNGKVEIKLMSIQTNHFWFNPKTEESTPPTINYCGCKQVAFPPPTQTSKYPKSERQEEERSEKAFCARDENHILLALILILKSSLRINGRNFQRWIDARSPSELAGIFATTRLPRSSKCHSETLTTDKMRRKRAKQLILESSMAFQAFGLSSSDWGIPRGRKAKEITTAIFKEFPAVKNTWMGVITKAQKRRK